MAFPLGLTRARTPALTGSLITHPPAGPTAAARRLALGLALMFALSPATRFGYFAYPAGLLGWTVPRQHLPSRPGLRPAA